MTTIQLSTVASGSGNSSGGSRVDLLAVLVEAACAGKSQFLLVDTLT